MPAQTRMTKKQKRILRQEGVLKEYNNLCFLNKQGIKPITPAQELAFESWAEGYNLFLHGLPGTGKTFLALKFALDVVMDQNSQYDKIIIFRSTVPTRDQGFQKGTREQKEAVYMDPYPPICGEIMGRDDAYSILKQRNMIEFRSTAFARGITLDNCIIVVDEVQNMSFQECDTIITRAGTNSKIIFSGDSKQDDLTSKRYGEVSGISDFMKIVEKMDEFDFIEFQVDDIVRSGLVRSYIIEKHKLGL